MGTLNEDLTEIKSVEDILTSNKVARFAYTENAYNNNDANGVDVYNVDNEQNIPNGTASIMKVNQTVINKGYRAQASSITRMLLNHFLGRLSYNVNKVNDNVSNLIATLIKHRGTANGLATLDVDGRIPYSQLPESAMEYKGTWNASTNTPTLADGTGNTGDMYMVSVEGTVDFGSGDITLYEGDSVVYNGSVWQRVAGGKEAQHAIEADTATAPLYQWKKIREDLFRHVAGETPSKTYYWLRVCEITTAMTFDIEVVGDNNYAYRATYRLSVTKYQSDIYTVALLNLGQTDAGQAKLAVALDADGYLYIQTNCEWDCSLHVTLLYSESSFSVTMDKLGYAPFGSASGFTPVKIITQTGGFRVANGVVVGTDISPIIHTNIIGNLTGNADTASKANVRVSLRHGNTWFNKTWTGLTDVYGEHVWTDGDNIYYSGETSQYVLNKATSTWTAKTWTGLTNFYGERVWTDGDNIYYSEISDQYVLNKATSTWVAKTWNGVINSSGRYIWTDGENIYFSNGTSQYVLNKATSTWTAKVWTGLTNFYGNRVWTDGENIYFNNETSHYVLNKATSTWTAKTWTGLTNFYGNRVWTDGENIYFSNETSHYVLNKATSKWTAKVWTGLPNFYGERVWTDGDNIYYSSVTNQYVLPATRHNYVDDDKYNSLFGIVTDCNCSTLSNRFVFGNV